ncbi:MAG: Asp23/Gls24 family envelope stress response protein [Anaerolineales bacterium]|nr:Asp23/Gls24 family envelope stress response protein [Anaerolineales bacterium]MCX7755884.1 Asp23/Gls24 family envelope stress response protein [Anaerolineales bacterium]MDW8277952.1 Asp23/Gls24 family envelope stress response protein [Anaerolineales bacterium]
MTEEYRSPGKTTLAPDVLLTIARMAALGVEGVARLASVPGGFDRLFRRGADDGVRLTVEDGLVYIELYLVLKSGYNVREVSRNVQTQVARAISEMVGMEVGHVNIHIEDIEYQAGE